MINVCQSFKKSLIFRRRSALLESKFNSTKDQGSGSVTPVKIEHMGNCLLNNQELTKDCSSQGSGSGSVQLIRQEERLDQFNLVSSNPQNSIPVTYLFNGLEPLSPMTKLDLGFAKPSFTPNATLSHQQDTKFHLKLKSEWKSLGEINRDFGGFSGKDINSQHPLCFLFDQYITVSSI